MPIVSAGTKEKMAPVPAGAQRAVCYSIIDIGTQTPPNPAYKPGRKVVITWELPDETISTEKGMLPRAISGTFGLSLGPKATLRKFLESWRGRPFTADELKGFDLKNVLGANGLLNVVHAPSKSDPSVVYANVGGIMPLPKGMTAVKATNELVLWDIPQSGPINIPDKIPAWIRERIMQSDEYKRYSGGNVQNKLEQGADPAIVGDAEAAPF